jgi:hypothetical protein
MKMLLIVALVSALVLPVGLGILRLWWAVADWIEDREIEHAFPELKGKLTRD